MLFSLAHLHITAARANRRTCDPRMPPLVVKEKTCILVNTRPSPPLARLGLVSPHSSLAHPHHEHGVGHAWSQALDSHRQVLRVLLSAASVHHQPLVRVIPLLDVAAIGDPALGGAEGADHGVDPAVVCLSVDGLRGEVDLYELHGLGDRLEVPGSM
eukprot:767968-Hanusia_phi.AAC.6